MPSSRSALPIVLVLLSGFAQVSFPRPADPSAVLRKALTEAEQALALGEPQIAESRYRTALQEGWLLLGALEHEQGRLEQAEAAFEHAAASAVEVRRPHLWLALVELQLGKAERAVALLRSLKQRDLADATVRALLPRALMAADQIDEAIQEMEELHVLAPEVLENTYALARAYLGQERDEEAAALFAELTSRRPGAETRVLIGRTYRDYGRWERAHEALEAAVAADPDVVRAHYYLGSVDLLAHGTDLLDEAMTHFEDELRVSPGDPMTNLYLGAALVERRRYEEAMPRLEAARRRLGDRPEPWQFLGRSYLALEHYDEAVDAFRRALELTEAELARPEAEGAVDRLQRQLSSLHYQLAQALRRRGDGAEAASHFAAAKESSASSAQGSRELLEIYLSEEEKEENLAASTFPLGVAPVSGVAPAQRPAVARAVERGLVQAYFNLGVQQAKAGKFARAARLYRQAAELEPGFPRLQFALGTALFNSQQFEEAAEPLERALAETPDDRTLERMLALAHFNAGSYEDAARLLRDDTERADNPALEYTYAVALVRSGRALEAEPVFERLLTENADWPELNVLLGQAHAQQDDFEMATTYLYRALALDASVAEAHATLADILLRQGRLDEAESHLRAELRAHPKDARARHSLAVVLDLNGKSDEAFALLGSLLEERPDYASARYLSGKILLARGEAEEARAQLEAAAELSPEDPNIRYQLGQAYQRLGLREQAAREIETYRRLKKAAEVDRSPPPGHEGGGQ